MPDVERLAPDVWRIDLPLPFRLRSINVYLVQGKDGCALVDTGIDMPDSRAAFFAALESIGIDQSAIRDVYVTHMHPDHIGLSGMHGARGATIHLMRDEEQRARYMWSAQPLDRWVGYFRAHGLDEANASAVTEAAAKLRKAVTLPDRFATLDDRDFVRLGGRAVRVVWTPGHSDFHYVLVDDDARAIFAGDHLLPTITPNIGLYPECRPNPLDDYLKSFARFERLGDYTVYPAHGKPYSALPDRVHQLVLHHRERLQGVWDCVIAKPEGACSADVVAHFWGDRLNSHETRFALVEVAAHLEYLRLAGDLSSSIADGTIRYHTESTKPSMPV
ncbi:MAG TPA: MBL fold metallo-hydrolase [Candidatus Eremiobacteraceae bacterium]